MSYKRWARLVDNTVVEIVGPLVVTPDEGEPYELAIDTCFPDWFIQTCVEITDLNPSPKPYWTYKDGVFTPDNVSDVPALPATPAP